MEINAEWNWNALTSWEINERRNRNCNSLLKFSKYSEPSLLLAVVPGGPWQLTKEWWSLSNVGWMCSLGFQAPCRLLMLQILLSWVVPWSWFVPVTLVEMDFWFIFLSLSFSSFPWVLYLCYFLPSLIILSRYISRSLFWFPPITIRGVTSQRWWICTIYHASSFLFLRLLISGFVYLPVHATMK